jgi:predicted ATPase with chaperone activity
VLIGAVPPAEGFREMREGTIQGKTVFLSLVAGAAPVWAATTAARDIQLGRFKGTKVHCNADMESRQVRKFCEPDAGGGS